jgi:hypothetical protein
MGGVIEPKESKVKVIISNLLRKRREYMNYDDENSLIEDGYDSDEELLNIT